VLVRRGLQCPFLFLNREKDSCDRDTVTVLALVTNVPDAVSVGVTVRYLASVTVAMPISHNGRLQ
jgi:hypothetical protein